jgi:hypothetical protein
MVVRDIDAAVDQWKKAGGTVFSTGGQAVTRPNGAGNVLVRDINGFMWELRDSRTRASPRTTLAALIVKKCKTSAASARAAHEGHFRLTESGSRWSRVSTSRRRHLPRGLYKS